MSMPYRKYRPYPTVDLPDNPDSAILCRLLGLDALD